MNSRGVYSIISSFMLIVVLVAVLLVLVYLGLRVSVNENTMLSEIQPFYSSIDAKDSLLYCLNPLTEARLNQETANPICLSRIPEIVGYEFRQLKFFNCQEKSWSVGETKQCNKTLYFLVDKEETKLNCLSMLTLCFKGHVVQRPPGTELVCGDGTINAPEQCENNNLNNQTCQTQGFTSGSLSCYPSTSPSACRFDTSGCTGATCTGNGCNSICPANCTAAQDPDCITGSVCTNDSCKNGNETGIDCGGACVTGTENNCTDGLDNDKDCLIDCGDADCAGNPICASCVSNGCNGNCPAGCTHAQDPDCGTPTCNDTCLNGSETGLDCGGSCIAGTENPATQCNDGIDNDKDCKKDCVDPDCATATNCISTCPTGHTSNPDGTCTATFPAGSVIGYIGQTGSPSSYVYQRSSGSSLIFLRTSSTWLYRGFIEWDVGSIPSSTVTKVDFLYHGDQFGNAGIITGLGSVRPSTDMNPAVFGAIGTGTVYASPSNFPVVAPNQSVTLNSAANADLQARLGAAGPKWFALGFHSSKENANASGPTIRVYGTPVPTLVVTYRP